MESRCISCDRELPEGATFCTACGAVVDGPLVTSSDVTGTIHSLGTTTTESGPLAPIGHVHDITAGRHVLLIDRGPSAGTQVELVGPEMTAGRAPDNAIFLDDITVSRQHVAFVLEDDVWRLKDLGSLNGTYVNRERIDEVQLRHGDQIQVGKYRFHFMGGADGHDHS